MSVIIHQNGVVDVGDIANAGRVDHFAADEVWQFTCWTRGCTSKRWSCRIRTVLREFIARHVAEHEHESQGSGAP